MARKPFHTEPAGYTKGAWSALQGAWQNLRDSVAGAHPFAESAHTPGAALRLGSVGSDQVRAVRACGTPRAHTERHRR